MKKVFSGIGNLPNGDASDIITEGCIVLEGGAFRGVYGEGVLDALMEADINFRCTIGVSAGALNGANYVSGQIGRSARINLRYRYDSRYVGLKALRNNHGIIGFDFAFQTLAESDPFHEKRFMDPSRQFIAVAASCQTGKAVYFEKGKCHDIMQAIRASASMPYVSKPVMVDGVACLDGGCCCKIPYQWALDHSFQKIVVVKTQHPDFRKKTSQKKGRLTSLFYKDYPLFAASLSQSAADYNRQCDEIERLQQDGRLFVFAPSSPVTVGRLEKNMEKLGALYYLGYTDAKKQIPALKSYLEQ